MKFLILLLILFVLLFSAILIMIEDKMIYFPAKYPEGIWNPEDYGLTIEDTYFKTEDGLKLHGWFAPSSENRITLLWFHGNAGNLSHRLENIKCLHELNINVFIFDYRGYGKSEGELPSEETLYIDSRAAYDYLSQKKKILKNNIFFFGRSLGGVAAIDLAYKIGCAGLIIESSLTSAKDMAATMFPFLPIKYIIKTKFDSEEKIKNITCPKLFIHGNKDNLIPFELGKKLFAAAPDPKEFYEINDAGHNDTYIVGGIKYFDIINKFLRNNFAKNQVSSQKVEGYNKFSSTSPP